MRPSNSGCTWHLLRYFHALPTIRVHPELDGRTLDIVHSLNGICVRELMPGPLFILLCAWSDEVNMHESPLQQVNSLSNTYWSYPHLSRYNAMNMSWSFNSFLVVVVVVVVCLKHWSDAALSLAIFCVAYTKCIATLWYRLIYLFICLFIYLSTRVERLSRGLV